MHYLLDYAKDSVSDETTSLKGLHPNSGPLSLTVPAGYLVYTRAINGEAWQCSYTETDVTFTLGDMEYHSDPMQYEIIAIRGRLSAYDDPAVKELTFPH